MDSANVSNPKNNKSPIVKDSRNRYPLPLSLLRKGNHSKPSSTGITPTYRPRRTKVFKYLSSAVGVKKDTSTCFSKVTPSLAIRVKAIGSPSVHGYAIDTNPLSNGFSMLSG